MSAPPTPKAPVRFVTRDAGGERPWDVGRLPRPTADTPEPGAARPTHRAMYVTVLRARPSEWDALALVRPAERPFLLPLLELPDDLLEQRPDTATRRARTRPAPQAFARQAIETYAARVLREAAAGRLVVDLTHVGRAFRFAPHGISVWDALAAAWPVGTPNITVGVQLGWRSGDYDRAAALAARFGTGACLRLSLEDVRRADLRDRIAGVLDRLGMGREDVDLVVDLAAAPAVIEYTTLAARLPGLSRWRTYAVVAGCFPMDLTDDDPDLQLNPHERTEWNVWLRQTEALAQAAAAGGGAVRLPAFGDYTTQCATFAPPAATSGSCSLRYTTDTQILVYRGRKIDRAKGYTSDQYIGHARTLYTSAEFYGGHFSEGDARVATKAHPLATGPGNPQYWRVAGINHHLATTLAQIASPDGTSTHARAVAAARGPWTPPPAPTRARTPRQNPALSGAPGGRRRSARTARHAASSAPPRPPQAPPSS